jgi:hypothetical protein
VGGVPGADLLREPHGSRENAPALLDLSLAHAVDALLASRTRAAAPAAVATIAIKVEAVVAAHDLADRAQTLVRVLEAGLTATTILIVPTRRSRHDTSILAEPVLAAVAHGLEGLRTTAIAPCARDGGRRRARVGRRRPLRAGHAAAAVGRPRRDPPGSGLGQRPWLGGALLRPRRSFGPSRVPLRPERRHASWSLLAPGPAPHPFMPAMPLESMHPYGYPLSYGCA